jgi:hypothetical protein
MKLKLNFSTSLNIYIPWCITKIYRSLLTTCFHAGFFLGLLFDTEDGGDMLLRKIGSLSNDYMALYLRRQHSSRLFNMKGNQIDSDVLIPNLNTQIFHHVTVLCSSSSKNRTFFPFVFIYLSVLTISFHHNVHPHLYNANILNCEICYVYLPTSCI